MANISTAYGTCYLQAKSKQNILDFIKKIPEKTRYFNAEMNRV